MSNTETAAVSDGVPKSTLFCPECEHQSRYDRDWLRVEIAGKTHYRCPDCHTKITVRPTGSAANAARETVAGWQPWERNLQMWQEFWQRVLKPG